MIARGLIVGSLLLLAVGCSKPVGTVKGTVTYKGKAVPGGYVMFIPADQTVEPRSVEIAKDGSFTAEGVPAGEVTVTIDNRSFEPQPKMDFGPLPPLPGAVIDPEVKKQLTGTNSAGSAAATPPAVDPSISTDAPQAPVEAGRYVVIPGKYYEAGTTDLKFTITTGEQTIAIELKD
jgi:hypothetical protein